MQGGGWRRDTYDFFSLPLFVRENTVLPLGGETARPDYDYTQGLTLRIYQMADGAEQTRRIPDLAGETALAVTVRRMGDTITVLPDRPCALAVEQIGTDCTCRIQQPCGGGSAG